MAVVVLKSPVTAKKVWEKKERRDVDFYDFWFLNPALCLYYLELLKISVKAIIASLFLKVVRKEL